MSKNIIVSVQPPEVADILSERENVQLINIIDKLLINDIQLQINYTYAEKSL